MSSAFAELPHQAKRPNQVAGHIFKHPVPVGERLQRGRYPLERLALFFSTVRKIWRILLAEWTGSKGRGGGALANSCQRGQMGLKLEPGKRGKSGKSREKAGGASGLQESQGGRIGG